MPKWTLYALAAIADFVIAVVAFMDNRVVIGAVLCLAGVMFIVAAIGAFAKTRAGKA